MLRFELRDAGTPDAVRANPFTNLPQTFPGKPGWTKSLEIDERGTEVLARFGKEPRLRTIKRTFASEFEARAFVAALVEARVDAGYEQVPAKGSLEPPPEHDSLLARMAAGDDDAYLVYVDVLLERGDPRGELLALLAKKPGVRDRSDIRPFLEEHGDALAGPLASRLDNANAKWRLGFLDSIRISWDYGRDGRVFSAARLLEAAFEHPSTCLLRRLTVGTPGNGGYEYDDVLATIATSGPESLRTLFIGDFLYPEDTEISWANLGDASALWLGLPNLEDVTFQGTSLTLGSIQAPKLRRLTIRTGGLRREPLRALARAVVPSLEQLELWLGDSNYGAEATRADIERLLGRSFSRLDHLGLCNAEITDEICDVIVRSPIAPQLRVLDLSKGTLSDGAAYQLVAERHRFERIEALDVSDNCLSETCCRHLRDVFPYVTTGEQKNERYVSVSE